MSIYDLWYAARRTVFVTWCMGAAYFIFFFVCNFLSNFLTFLPYDFRLFLILGGGFAIVMYCLWKISDKDGYELERKKEFNKKQQLIGACVGLVLDAGLFLLLTLLNFKFISTCYSFLHFYACFPGSLFAKWFSWTASDAMVLSAFLDLPIVIAVRYWGLSHGSNVKLAELELLDEAKKNSSKVLNK